MKSMQEAIEIRRVYSETGGNVSETARRCECGRDTVRRALARDYCVNGGRKKRRHPHPEDRAIESVIMENLADAARSRKLRLTAARIARIVRSDGCELSERQLVKRVSVVRRRLKDAPAVDVYLELDAPRGAFQVDFGQCEFYLDDVRTVAHVLILSSAFSNAFASVACAGEDAACLFDGIERCFEILGGVPPVLRFDNLPPAVSWDGKKRRITDSFSRFVAHHKFRAEFCNPCSGWEKGNVENKVRYIRNNFFNPVNRCRFRSLDELNRALLRFCENDRQRVHYKKHRMIRDLFESEKQTFGDLMQPFGYSEQLTASVDKQGFVRFRGNRYFTTHDNRFTRVIVSADAHTVHILSLDMKPIATHTRAFGKDQRIQPADELARMLARKPAAIPYVIRDAESLRDRLRGVRSCDRVEPILEVLTRQKEMGECASFCAQRTFYTPDLKQYDKLTDEQRRRNNAIMQPAEIGIGHPGDVAGAR